MEQLYGNDGPNVTINVSGGVIESLSNDYSIMNNGGHVNVTGGKLIGKKGY